ncbi:MAG: phosphate ABC transporter substrate-binding protein PstS, partial [Akkermansia sp.]|nr:phosphate ABC transporter substrate-binding protein PstS [Akkermansia sp.]
MFKNLFIAALGLCTLAQAETTITGAGASFPAPVYQKWTYAYSQQNPDTQVTYQSMGSGAGLNQIKAGTVDFAGSDNPLTLEQQNEAGLEQYPMLTGGVVVIVNIPGVKDNQLKLSQDVLARIFLGEITSWNDPAIKALNPKLKLPKLKITVVRRADSSGTSFIFTNYLSKISADWKKKVGQGSAVKWPVGIGGQKNPGVCNNVARTRGAIGYTEYTYAVEAKLACAMLENASG